ncbi:tanabin-like [Teleopsis dalmanni]|uniref:tanabin-like n=1 Tax=Teleopsis dalmanni TaxID=139649 RepID=UPI0018CCF2EA|nr:tanabin-like [Teleopsis dalmanni]
MDFFESDIIEYAPESDTEDFNDSVACCEGNIKNADVDLTVQPQVSEYDVKGQSESSREDAWIIPLETKSLADICSENVMSDITSHQSKISHESIWVIPHETESFADICSEGVMSDISSDQSKISRESVWVIPHETESFADISSEGVISDISSDQSKISRESVWVIPHETESFADISSEGVISDISSDQSKISREGVWVIPHETESFADISSENLISDMSSDQCKISCEGVWVVPHETKSFADISSESIISDISSDQSKISCEGAWVIPHETKSFADISSEDVMPDISSEQVSGDGGMYNVQYVQKPEGLEQTQLGLFVMSGEDQSKISCENVWFVPHKSKSLSDSCSEGSTSDISFESVVNERERSTSSLEDCGENININGFVKSSDNIKSEINDANLSSENELDISNIVPAENETEEYIDTRSESSNLIYEGMPETSNSVSLLEDSGAERKKSDLKNNVYASSCADISAMKITSVVDQSVSNKRKRTISPSLDFGAKKSKTDGINDGTKIFSGSVSSLEDYEIIDMKSLSIDDRKNEINQNLVALHLKTNFIKYELSIIDKKIEKYKAIISKQLYLKHVKEDVMYKILNEPRESD